MKKILILTFNYVPYNVTGTFRIMRFIKYLPKFGIKPYVVTAEQGDHHINENLILNIPKEAEIYRFKSRIPDTQQYNSKVSFLYDKHGNVLKHNFIKIVKYLKDLILSPDIYIVWCILILPKIVKLIYKEKIKILLVTGGPFSLFLLATVLTKMMKIKLIFDYRDPWQTNPSQLQQTVIRRKLNCIFEKYCLKNADLVIGTTTQIIHEVEEIYQGNTLVIPNGIDKDDYKNVNFSEVEKEKFLIGYTGKFDVTNNTYNPIFFLEIFKKFLDNHKGEKIKLVIIGDINKKTKQYIEQKGLSDSVIFKGLLGFENVIKEEAKCNILLHFYYPAKLKNTISIKLLEYLQLHKPILSLNTRNSAIENLINKVSAGFVVENDDETAILDKLNDLYKSNLSKYLNDRNDEYLKKYDVEFLTETLAKEIYRIGE